MAVKTEKEKEGEIRNIVCWLLWLVMNACYRSVSV